MKVLVLGGYGVFGGRLARLLLEDGVEVVVAGRSETKAQAFCDEFGGAALALDKNDRDAVSAALRGTDVLVDAIGPFQGYDGYPLAEAAIAAGCHYLDLSDDAGFTAGISALDASAKAAGVAVLSGVSSVPALSSAAVEALKTDLSEITLIDTAILPGNRASRGWSVMEAILSQVGRPLAQWRGGAWVDTPAWGGVVRRALPKGLRRPASPIGAPDLVLFPEAYQARSVLFRAGLELGVMHHGLRVFGWLHRKGLLPRLDKLTWPMLQAARMLSPFGSDQGGMSVVVAGRAAEGAAQTRGWRLHMDEGQGPFVPAVPALLMVRRFAQGRATPGAGPALGCFDLAEAEEVLFGISGSFDRDCPDMTPLFEKAIGREAWDTMPTSYRTGHDLWDRHVMRGTSKVTRGKGALARFIAAVFRFPPERDDTPLTVTMERIGETEKWTRNFDGQRFFSVLSYAGPGRVRERFGPFEFELDLPVNDGRMEMNVMRGWVMGLPMPAWALPKSETAEFDQNGVFRFDVKISAPVTGMIVHYQGQLRREDLIPPPA